jgi:outer membrane receptor for ferrienterochelin and colicins
VKYISVFWAAGLLAGSLQAQSADSTRVTIEARHAGSAITAIRAVIVAAPGLPAGRPIAATAGRLLLRLATPGDYRIELLALGYAPDTLELGLRAGHPDTSLAVELQPLAEELEELVVASTRSGRRVDDDPIRVEVLGREEIEEKLLMTPGDISMMLNETGGLRVQTTSPSLGGATLRVQGLRGRYTLLLADGLPLYGGQAGGLGLLQIAPMDLGRVEIIKGTSSALYGSSAMGGVINLISKAPPSHGTPGERDLLLNLTTLGGKDAIAWGTGSLGRGSGYTMLGGVHQQPRRDRDADGWTDVPGYRRVVLRPRLFLGTAEGPSLFLTLGTTQEDRTGGTLGGGLAPDGAPFVETLRTARYDIGVVGEAPVPNGAAAFRAAAMTQRHAHRFGESREDDRHTTWFGEATIRRTLGRSVLAGGVALQGERYRSEQVGRFDYQVTVPGIFLHGELAAWEGLTAALSARADRHSRYGSFLSPRVSLLMVPGQGWSVRASAGTGFFAPTPFTEDTEITGLTRLAPIDGLVAERARSASLDIQRIAGRLELSATLFGSLVDHAVQLIEGTDGPELRNAPDVTRTYGADLVARYRAGPLAMTASYALTRSIEPDPEGGPRREVPLTPRHSAGVVVVHEQEGKSRIGLELYYTGRQRLEDRTYRSTSRPYLIVGLLAERRFGRARLFLNLENLGGVRQTTFVPLVRPTRTPAGRWTTDAWAPLDGRVINGGIRLSR